MLSETEKTAIFTGLPKTPLTIGATSYTPYVEYADRGPTVTELLRDHPLVATLRYYNDLPDPEASAGNQLIDRKVVGSDLQYTHGKKRQVTASLNIYACDSNNLPAADLVDTYANAVLLWVQNTLPKTISIARDPSMSDLSYLETAGTERRQVEWLIRYEVSSIETIKTVDTMDPPDIDFS